MISLLIWINFLIPVVCTLKNCVSKRGVEVNHIFLFSVGFIYYWILPFALGNCRYFEDEPGMQTWYGAFDSIPKMVLASYLLVCLCCYFCFLSGTWLAGSIVPKSSRKYKNLRFCSSALNLFLIPALIPIIYFIFTYRNELFRGYLRELSGKDGTFIAFSLVVFCIAMLYSVKRDTRHEESLAFRKMYFNKFFLIYFVIAVLILSLGIRLYFVSTILILLVYQSVYRRKTSKRNACFFFLATFVFMTFIGLFRSGTALTARRILAMAFFEPLYVTYSTVVLLEEKSLDVIRVPVYLLSDLINLTPSFLLPSKAEFILRPDALGGLGGGFSSFVSCIVNFGMAGTFIVLFLFSFLLSFLKRGNDILLFRVMYACISGWLALCWFRDPFSVSIVKNMFQFSILTPILVVLGAHVLTMAAKFRQES